MITFEKSTDNQWDLFKNEENIGAIFFEGRQIAYYLTDNLNIELTINELTEIIEYMKGLESK